MTASLPAGIPNPGFVSAPASSLLHPVKPSSAATKEKRLVLERRYREFRALYKQLRKTGYHTSFQKQFPSKFVWDKFDPVVLEHRRCFLTSFLNDAWKACQTNAQQFSLLTQFLYGFEGDGPSPFEPSPAAPVPTLALESPSLTSQDHCLILFREDPSSQRLLD